MRPTLSGIWRRAITRARLNLRNIFSRPAFNTPRTTKATGLWLPALCFVVALTSFNAAQQPQQQPRQPEQPDMTIDAATRTQVIEGVLKNLNEAYLYPETAKRMEQAVREQIGRAACRGR